MVEDVQKQRAFPQAGIGSLLGGARTTTLPNEVDALAKQQYDWDRANTEFSRFHAKSDPTAQKWEQGAYERRGNPAFVNARSPMVFRNTQWSPNYPGPKFDTRFRVGSSGSSKSMNRRDYYDQMKGTEQNWMDILKGDVRQGLGISNEPAIKAGITNPNLGGYRVMNASDPTADSGWIDRLSRWIFGDNDPENDFQGLPPDDTIDEGDYYDPNNPNHFMVPEENPPYDPDNPYHFKIPEGMDLDDIDIEELINMERYNI